MRYILTILSIFILQIVSAQTNYYVDVTGSDGNTGTSALPFKTIGKAVTVAVSGDSILLKAGQSWNEKLILTTGGIHFNRYGTGDRPNITGLTTTTFSDSSGIKYATLTDNPPKLNLLLIDGNLAIKARYPYDGSFLTASSATSYTLTSSALTGTPNYSGYECVVKTGHWILDKVKVASQSTSTLTFQDSLSKNGFASGANGFFFQNSPSFISASNTWAFDSATRKLRVNTSGSIQYSNKDTLIFISHKDGVSFNNIVFEGANKVGVQVDTSRLVSFTNCTFKNMGGMGIRGMKNNRFSLLNDSLYNILDNGLSFWPSKDGVYIPVSPTTNQSDTCVFKNNYIKNIGVYVGMGGSGNVHYEGLISVGDSCIIQGNTIDNTGYSSIYFNGQNTLVYRNYITNYCFNKDDGAAIQSGLGGAVKDSGSIVRSNIIFNGIGNDKAVSYIASAAGIYIDDNNSYVWIDSNIINKSHWMALMMHNTGFNTVTNNLVFNSGSASFGSYPVAMGFYAEGSGTYLGKTTNNVFIADDSTSFAAFYYSDQHIIGTCDSNIYIRPAKNTLQFTANHSSLRYLGLTDWKTYFSQDAHSDSSLPSVITSLPYIFIYNPTQADSIVSLPFKGIYKDIKGNKYYQSVTLHPFKGLVLWQSAMEGEKRLGTLIFKK